MKNINKHTGLIIYLISIIALTYFGFFPKGRVWGINIWGYFELLLLFGFFAIFSLLGFAVFIWGEKILNGLNNSSFKITIWIISLLTFCSFIMLRVKSYFLGDGYTILALIASGNPLMEKKRQLIESYSHIYLYNILGGNGVGDAISSYQLLSFFSGILFISFTIYSSIKLFEDLTSRVLFVLGLLSSGYMLLYFGYVEHYSMFSLSILISCTVGLLVLQQKVSKWILLFLVPLSISLHVFGVALVPPALYLIYKGGKIETQISKIKKLYLYIISAVSIVAILSIFIHFYLNDYFFQISLVPFYTTRLTQEGYTIFSVNHLIDYANLMLLLVPGILILLINIFRLQFKKIIKHKEYLFLSLFTLSSLGVTFIFDPKLGMTRDWDLFAFCGVPLAFTLYYILIKHIKNKKFLVVNILLSILLGYCVLLPRAYSLTNDEISIKHFKEYLSLDKVKNRNSWVVLVNYYKDKGDTINSDIVFKEWKSNFPEEVLMKQANKVFYEDKNLPGTINILYNILEMNPTYSDAYAFLGDCYILKRQYDSAITLLRMSDALSPNRAHNIDNLGRAYHYKKDFDNALKCYLKSNYLDSSNFIFAYNLARLYLDTRDYEKYHQQMMVSASHKGAVDKVFKELILSHLNRSEYEEAKQIISEQESIKNDSLFLKNINSKYRLNLQ